MFSYSILFSWRWSLKAAVRPLQPSSRTETASHQFEENFPGNDSAMAEGRVHLRAWRRILHESISSERKGRDALKNPVNQGLDVE
jgi:hypothetical protein